MVMHKKLVEVTQARIFMTGTPLTEFLKAKLKTCIEEDPRLDNFYLAFNTEVTITVQTRYQHFSICIQLLFVVL